MAQTIVGADVVADLLDHIVTRTDEVPLFVEEVTRFCLASQRLHGQAERRLPLHYPPSPFPRRCMIC